MAYVNVDINLDEFDTDEIIEHLETLKLKPEEKERLRLLFGPDIPVLKSAPDLWKVEFFMDNIDKISLESLEAIVNRKMEMA